MFAVNSENSTRVMLWAAIGAFTAVSVHSFFYNQRQPDAPVVSETATPVAEPEAVPPPSVFPSLPETVLVEETADPVENESPSPEEYSRLALDNIKRFTDRESEQDAVDTVPPAVGSPDAASASVSSPDATSATVGSPDASFALAPAAAETARDVQSDAQAAPDLPVQTSAVQEDVARSDEANATAPLESLRPAARPEDLARASVAMEAWEPAADYPPMPQAETVFLPEPLQAPVEPPVAAVKPLAAPLEAPVAQVPPVTESARDWSARGGRKIVGIFETGSRRWALVQDGADQVHIVEEGDRIGAGMIASIADGTLTISVGPAYMTYSTGDTF